MTYLAPDRPRTLPCLAASECGESILSTALTLPVLISFVFGLMQLCLAYYSIEMISETAREATRYAIVHGATCQTVSGASCTVGAAGLQTYATSLGWPNLAGGVMTAAVSFPDGDQAPGHRVQVRMTYVFTAKIPFENARPLSMSSSSQMYILM